MAPSSDPDIDLAAAVASAIPDLDRLRAAADGGPIYLVGGAVRDILLGREPPNIDVVVVGDAAEVARRLGGEQLSSQAPFATARAPLGGTEVDLASARAESYSHPGALPEVRAAGLEEDLARRDFTVNAMAVPLQGEAALIDPHGGRSDLDAGLLRVLHDASFFDDPTRALRGARYAARLGFAPDPHTAELLRAADLSTVSADRVRGELMRTAVEPEAVAGLLLVIDWELLEPRPGARELLPAVGELVSRPPWSAIVERPRAFIAAAFGAPGREAELARADPGRPSEAVEAARGSQPEELILARAMGADWLDDYVTEWRSTVLEIGGEDLIEAGVPEGPAVGRGLAAALRRKLDGEIAGRTQELEAALEAARDQPANGG